MRAIEIREPGGPGVLCLTQRPDPKPGPTEVLIRVHFAGVNRPDVLQRKGEYAPPPGASDIPGLEVSGIVEAAGAAVSRWRTGDKICALLAGGGYAELALADETHCLPAPASLSMAEAAALPETVFTVWSNVFERGRLARGEVLLVHGGAGGIGTTAIQLAKAFGARVLATAGSAENLEFCRDIGADAVINYKVGAFDEQVRELTGGKGVDVILDIVGAPYLQKNLAALAPGGRLSIIGMQGGHTGEVDLRPVLKRHLTITASTLRPRSLEEKARLAREVEAHVWPLIAAGRFKPRVERVVPLAAATKAHEAMEAADHKGKIVLEARAT